MNSLSIGIGVVGVIIAIWLKNRKKGDFTDPQSLMKDFRGESDVSSIDDSEEEYDNGEDVDGANHPRSGKVPLAGGTEHRSRIAM